MEEARDLLDGILAVVLTGLFFWLRFWLLTKNSETENFSEIRSYKTEHSIKAAERQFCLILSNFTENQEHNFIFDWFSKKFGVFFVKM